MRTSSSANSEHRAAFAYDSHRDACDSTHRVIHSFANSHSRKCGLAEGARSLRNYARGASSNRRSSKQWATTYRYYARLSHPTYAGRNNCPFNYSFNRNTGCDAIISSHSTRWLKWNNRSASTILVGPAYLCSVRRPWVTNGSRTGTTSSIIKSIGPFWSGTAFLLVNHRTRIGASNGWVAVGPGGRLLCYVTPTSSS